ncbi:hypothetical protein N7520_007125 [Penicillium odoratum]|uniref:uncharacterized protein n=1 Tax=Penicillium odoratum TaxID=1167516 RepID=UPI002547320C|nr:uncharacterized protein N7520_007125 [Penicillium odoratum]KAJ5759969.1 hypothetical protein N7520_007125 [Penicillium odoratum]
MMDLKNFQMRSLIVSHMMRILLCRLWHSAFPHDSPLVRHVTLEQLLDSQSLAFADNLLVIHVFGERACSVVKEGASRPVSVDIRLGLDVNTRLPVAKLAVHRFTESL